MKEKQPKSTLPFLAEYTNAKNKIVNAVNEAMTVHKIPCYLLESVISDILHQIESGAKLERERTMKEYEQQQQKTEG